MENTKQVIPENIHLQSIKVTDGTIKSDPDVDNSVISSFKTEFVLQQGIDLINQICRFLFTVKLEALDNEEKDLKIIAEYTTEFIFQIIDLADFITKNEEKENIIYLNKQLGTTLIGIVYSTMRGIVLTRTQGTIIDGVILPVIDPGFLLDVYADKQLMR